MAGNSNGIFTSVTDERLMMKKNLLATLFLSRGVPMLPAGDEFDITQKGNNNAWCQDPRMIDMKPYNRLAGIYFCGTSRDNMKIDNDIYVIFNMHWEVHDFKLPIKKDEIFRTVFSTDKAVKTINGTVTVGPRSVVVLEKM